MTSCLLFEGWFAHLLPTRAAVQAVENCSLWLLAENGFWAADQICIVASRWSRWLLAFASYLYMLYSNYIYLCDMDMGMNLYEFDIYIYIYVCVCVYRSIYRIYIYIYIIYMSMCPAFVPIFCVVPVSTGHPRRSFEVINCCVVPWVRWVWQRRWWSWRVGHGVLCKYKATRRSSNGNVMG